MHPFSPDIFRARCSSVVTGPSSASTAGLFRADQTSVIDREDRHSIVSAILGKFCTILLFQEIKNQTPEAVENKIKEAASTMLKETVPQDNNGKRSVLSLLCLYGYYLQYILQKDKVMTPANEEKKKDLGEYLMEGLNSKESKVDPSYFTGIIYRIKDAVFRLLELEKGSNKLINLTTEFLKQYIDNGVNGLTLSNDTKAQFATDANDKILLKILNSFFDAVHNEKQPDIDGIKETLSNAKITMSQYHLILFDLWQIYNLIILTSDHYLPANLSVNSDSNAVEIIKALNSDRSKKLSTLVQCVEDLITGIYMLDSDIPKIVNELLSGWFRGFVIQENSSRSASSLTLPSSCATGSLMPDHAISSSSIASSSASSFSASYSSSSTSSTANSSSTSSLTSFSASSSSSSTLSLVSVSPTPLPSLLFSPGSPNTASSALSTSSSSSSASSLASVLPTPLQSLLSSPGSPNSASSSPRFLFSSIKSSSSNSASCSDELISTPASRQIGAFRAHH